MKKLFGVLALAAGLLVLFGCDLYQPDVTLGKTVLAFHRSGRGRGRSGGRGFLRWKMSRWFTCKFWITPRVAGRPTMPPARHGGGSFCGFQAPFRGRRHRPAGGLAGATTVILIPCISTATGKAH